MSSSHHARKQRRPNTAGKSNIRFGLGTLKNMDLVPNQRPAGRGGGGQHQQQQPHRGRPPFPVKRDDAKAIKAQDEYVSRMDWDLWTATYDLLWGEGVTEASIEQALTNLRRWRREAHDRRLPSLFPAYMAATLDLATVVMADTPPDAPSASSSVPSSPAPRPQLAEEVLVHAYCGALTRVVVEMTERRATAGGDGANDSQGHAAAAATTYRQRAAGVNLPAEVVEARNLAAHGRPPPLAMLRWAALVTMAHLRLGYWDVQRDSVSAMRAHQVDLAAAQAAKERQRALEAVDRAVAKAKPTVAPATSSSAGTAAATTSGRAAALSFEELKARLSGLGSS